MSYYYSYYIGYELNGKIYPLGAFNSFNKLCAVREISRSFASDLHNYFSKVKDSQITTELRKCFEYTDWNGIQSIDVKYLPFEDLPEGSFIKKGYFLIDDVKQYEEDDVFFDGFYDTLTPEVYAVKMKNELTFGKNQPKKDCDGYEYTEPNASDYMYYAYPDYSCREYDAHVIRLFADALCDYNSLPEGAKLVVLETEG